MTKTKSAAKLFVFLSINHHVTFCWQIDIILMNFSGYGEKYAESLTLIVIINWLLG